MQHDLKKKVGVFCLIPWFWRLEILVLLFDFFVSGCVLAVIFGRFSDHASFAYKSP